MKKSKGLRRLLTGGLAGATLALTLGAVGMSGAIAETGGATYPDVGLPASGYPKSGTMKENLPHLSEVYEHADKDAANGEANAPRTYVDRNGFTVQPTPDDGIGWNVSYLDADQRGCTACHSLEDALMSLPTYHRLIFMGYPTEQTLANCIVCHSWSPTPLKDTIHSLHMSSPVFTAMNGNCQSCHYINDEGGFERWDYVKYDVLHGITDVSAEDANLTISYDQGTLSETDQMFYKTICTEPNEWLTDDSVIDDSLYENWTIEFTGDIANPCSMTLPELVEKFGVTSEVMKANCVVNGVGNATIFQAEVAGIDFAALVDYLQPKKGCNVVRPIGDDGYHTSGLGNAIPLDLAYESDSLIVTQMNGEILPNTQGYPAAFWVKGISAADYIKRLATINFETVDPEAIADPTKLVGVGQFIDPASGVEASKPNSAVLNYPSGVVLEDQVGKPVHLEGYADAWDEPITKVEFSLDHGKTWTEMKVKNCDVSRWVYWQLDFTPEAAGSYLLEIRTTSQTAKKTDRVCYFNTEFLFNVR